jgi:uncharacterized membrane protein YjdF
MTLTPILFFIVIQILTIFLLIKAGRDRYEGIIVATSLFIIYILLELKYDLELNNYIRIILIITMLTDSTLGRYFNFYKTKPSFDILLHIFGTYSFSLFAYSLISQIFPNSYKSNCYRVIFVITLGIALGTIFEIIEFLFDILINSSTKHQNGLIDTNLDLIADSFGAIIAALHLFLSNFNLVDTYKKK